jgi:2-C-methyl-D-erythritol 2,4-cyclodiphosphate synthase
LGCVEIDGSEGLAGHSDGDVVCHAIADALLGAAALGDVGLHFPDSDPSVEGISGEELLVRTRSLLAGRGLRPVSCDATVICERPSIAPIRDLMREHVARALSIDLGSVSIKATRPEGLGLIGDGIGCLAIAVVA